MSTGLAIGLICLIWFGLLVFFLGILSASALADAFDPSSKPRHDVSNTFHIPNINSTPEP